MKQKEPKRYPYKKKEAYYVLEKLFEAEMAIWCSKDDKEKLQIALEAAEYFTRLNNCFFSIPLTFQMYAFPSDDEGGRTIEDWRKMMHWLIDNEIPLGRKDKMHLCRALLALNDGEVQQVVEPSVTGKRKRAWTLSKFQFLAVIHSHVLRGSGLKAKAARQKVAKAFGYPSEGGDETVRTWETRELKKYFHQDFISIWKEDAKQLGSTGLNFETEDSVDEILLESFIKSSDLEKLPLHFKGGLLRNWSIEKSGQFYKRALKGEEVDLPPFI